MIKIIIKFTKVFSDFSYINHNYYLSFKEFFESYLNNNLIHSHKIFNKKFKKELENFSIYIYKQDFFQAWCNIYHDSIINWILHMKNINLLIKYMEYKYTFWNSFFEKVLYSYSIFILTIFFTFFIKNFLNLIYIIYIYLFIYIFCQIIFYIFIVQLVKWNYKSYLNRVNKNNLFENRIYIHDFLETYNYLNKKIYNIENIYKEENSDFTYKFEKIWKIIFLLPYGLNLLNITLSIFYIFFIIYIMFQNILSINTI